MYKSLAALSVAAALMFAVPQSASALPGQTNGIKNSEATNVVKGAAGVTATGGIATGAIVVDTVTAITTGAVVRTSASFFKTTTLPSVVPEALATKVAGAFLPG